MKTETGSGGSAFPLSISEKMYSELAANCIRDGSVQDLTDLARSMMGLSYVDYMAGQALIALTPDHSIPENVASEAYDYAEAMLAERNKRAKETNESPQPVNPTA